MLISQYSDTRLTILWLLIVFSSVTATPVAWSTQHTAANTTELQNAISAAQDGDTILVGSGDYGSLNWSNIAFADYVKIKSSKQNQPAKFGSIRLENCAYLVFENIDITATGREGFGVYEGSHHIQLLNSTIQGGRRFDRNNPSHTQVGTLYGVNLNGGGGDQVSDLLIEAVAVTDVQSSAYLFSGIKDSVIRSNHCDWVASDCYKLAGADGILFENNFGAQNIHSAPGAHVDFVQGQGAVSNSVFRGNVALMGSATFQGLFFDDATFTNLTFENNLIHNANIRGISVSQGSGIVARYNTVLTVADPAGNSGRYSKASLILLPPGSTKENNIEANITTKNAKRFVNGNVVSQWNDDDDIAHYSDYYLNATAAPFAKVIDFTPKPGSLADGQFGAFARIKDILMSPSATNPSMITPIQLLLLSD